MFALSLIARFMGPTWDPSGVNRTHVGPMWAPWALLSGVECELNQDKSMLVCHRFSDVTNLYTMTSSNENIFRVTGPLCGEFIGHRKIPQQRQVTRSLDVSLICVWTNGGVNNRDASDLRRHHAHYGVTVMSISPLVLRRICSSLGQVITRWESEKTDII